MYLTSNRKPPDDIVRKDVVRFTNAPSDHASWYLLQLISLHLYRLTLEEKRIIINTLQEILNIKAGWDASGRILMQKKKA